MHSRSGVAVLAAAAVLIAPATIAQDVRRTILVRTAFESGAVRLTLKEGPAQSTVPITGTRIPDRLHAIGVRDALPTTELPAGSDLRLTMATCATPAVVAGVERRVGPPATAWGALEAEARGYELWYVRRFFDFDSWRATDLGRQHIQMRQALFLASRLIAAHLPSWDERRIWLRGRGDYLLGRFQEAAHAHEVIAEHGPPALLARIQELEQASKTAAGHIVVIEATVARPIASNNHPIGGWHWFPLAIYVDDTGEQLRPIFSPRSSRGSIGIEGKDDRVP